MLAIEMILLKDLPEIFSPDLVVRMDKTVLNFIASEPAEDQNRRRLLQQKLAKLEKAKEVCDDYQYMIKRGKF